MQALGLDAIPKLLACKSVEQKEETARALADMPETLTVYRGEGSASTSYDKSVSWTLLEKVAYFFAGRYSKDNCRVYKGTVSKSDVIEYIDGRNEAEIIVLPESVNEITAHSTIEFDDFLDMVRISRIDSRHPFPPSTMFMELRERINHVYKYTGEVPDHTADHTIPRCRAQKQHTRQHARCRRVRRLSF